MELDPEIGVAPAQPAEPRHQPVRGEGRHDADPDRAVPPLRADGLGRVAHALPGRGERREIGGPRFGEIEAARVAPEQPDAELSLQHADAAAEGRDREVHVRRGAGEAPRPRHRDEGIHGTEGKSSHAGQSRSPPPPLSSLPRPPVNRRWVAGAPPYSAAAASPAASGGSQLRASPS